MSYNSGYCGQCDDDGCPCNECVYYPEEPKVSLEAYDWPASYPKKPELWPEPAPKPIRSPSDILAEEAAELIREQERLRELVDSKLPRKPGSISEIPLYAYSEEVYKPIVTELIKAGWEAKVQYNKLVIRFPQEVNS